MKRYTVTARLLSPLVVKRDRQSERSGGVSTISGTMVRGALAQTYLRSQGAADATFRRLFLDEGSCRFGPLDPASRLFPLTSVSCKREAGPLAAGKHGIKDMLWDRIAQRLGAGAGFSDLGRCVKCHHDLKQYSGFYQHPNQPSQRTAAPRHTVTTHVGIDRITNTAAESIFFTLEAMEAGPGSEGGLPSLTGWIDMDDECHAALTSLLQAQDSLVVLGHARTRGYGRVALTVDGPLDSRDRFDRGRIAAWSENFVRSTAGDVLDAELHFVFSLTMPSGAILVDALLRNSWDPSDAIDWLPPMPVVDDNRPVLGREGREVDGGELRCLTAITRQERVRGWNAALGLPRQDEWAVARGSVYAYVFEGDKESRESLLDRLERLQGNGLGLRRSEGFGDVVVSDEFHRVYHHQER